MTKENLLEAADIANEVSTRLGVPAGAAKERTNLFLLALFEVVCPAQMPDFAALGGMLAKPYGDEDVQ